MQCFQKSRAVFALLFLVGGLMWSSLSAAFPVDVRHNAKIFREKLAAWAAKRLR